MTPVNDSWQTVLRRCAAALHNHGVEPTRLSGKVFLLVQIVAYTVWLRAVNTCSRRPVIGHGDVDVSLTTYGQRTRRVWRTLETIGHGDVLPRRLILWHEDESVVRNPPRPLRRLQRRGLTIKHCTDYGPHKKYFPYVVDEVVERPLVTADDDVLYPSNWLTGLLAVYRSDQVAAYRARAMNPGPYASWPLCSDTAPSFDLMSMGVSGVIYPPKVLLALRERGDEFMAVCPRADDIWLHYAAVASGIPTRQVSPNPAKWWPVRPKERGLWHENLAQGGNDAVVGIASRVWLGGGDDARASILVQRQADSADSSYGHG